MARIACALRRLEQIATWGGCLCLFALMLVVTADVAARYFLNQPFVWSHDVITLYLTPALFFLTLSDSFRSGAQVNVDIVHALLPRWLRRLTDPLCNLLAFGVFVLIAYAGAGRAYASFLNGDVTVGIVPWPTWPSVALVPLGAGMLAFRLLIRALAEIAGLAVEPAQDTHALQAQGAFE